MSAADAPVIPGLTFVRPLGSGGYADVYLYEQQSPRMNVAVKVLKRQGLTAAIRRQFVDEANTMAQLADHPFIVQVFRSEQTADGGAYLVMKYYPPPNLAQRAKAERLSVEEVLRSGIQLASAVETAHRAGIIHRDIKPANVLVSQYGQPGLTDFGIAGRGGHAEDVDEDVGVSVPWSAPEVLYGQSNGDSRSDVYSLAATLWHLLVGRSPFEQPGGDNSAYALMPRIRADPGADDRPRRRAGLPRATPRRTPWPRTRTPDRRRPSSWPGGSRRSSRSSGSRGPRSSSSTRRAAPRSRTPRRPGRRGPRTTTGRACARSPCRPPRTRCTPRPVRSTRTTTRPPTVSGGVVLGALAVLVAVTVGVVVWAVNRGDEPAPTPAANTLTRTAAPSRAIDYPEQPAIDARAAAGSVTFSWNYVGAEEGDFFQLRVAGTEAAVADADVVTVSDGATHRVGAKSGGDGVRPGGGVAQVGAHLAPVGDPVRGRPVRTHEERGTRWA